MSVLALARRVEISPRSVAPGLVTFDVTNQAPRTLELWLAGLGGNCLLGTSGPVATRQTAQFTVELGAGAYTIGPCRRKGAPGALVAKLTVVGPTRSGANDVTP